MTLRIAAVISILASLILAAFAALCWTASNVYFRPVHYAIREGEGDPYMIAIKCGSQLASEMLLPTFVLAFMNMLMAIAILRSSTGRIENTDLKNN